MEKIVLKIYDFELRCMYEHGICLMKYRFNCNKDQIIKVLKEYIPLPGSITCIMPSSQKFSGAELYIDYKWKNDKVAVIKYGKKDNKFKITFNKKFNTLSRTNTKY